MFDRKRGISMSAQIQEPVRPQRPGLFWRSRRGIAVVMGIAIALGLTVVLLTARHDLGHGTAAQDAPPTVQQGQQVTAPPTASEDGDGGQTQRRHLGQQEAPPSAVSEEPDGRTPTPARQQPARRAVGQPKREGPPPPAWARPPQELRRPTATLNERHQEYIPTSP
jgi:hypothetical protein